MTPDPNPAGTAEATAEVVLREQRLTVTTARVPTERVVLRRRVVTETRQVEVTIRREELEVLRQPVDPDQASVEQGLPGVPGAPLVIVLSEQVPVLQLQTRAYEQITVSVDVVAGSQELHEQVTREQAEVTQHPVGSAPR